MFFTLSGIVLGYRFMMLTLCILCDIKLLASTRAALTLHQRENNPLPNQDRRTKVCTLFQSLAFPHRLGPAHEPTARTQPFKHKRSQSLVSCDTCKNKPVHEVMPFRPLSTNAQKSCCSKTTYQHELEKKKTHGTSACNNRGIIFLDVPGPVSFSKENPKSHYSNLFDETPLYIK